ncbi:hypothetical protein MMC11_002191 [Xylographa trunciseda]|nr:hypothetical protein [Xylographa trunciseda]
MASLTTIPRELFDRIFSGLAPTAKIALVLTCSKLYNAKPQNLMKECKSYERFSLCVLWERDQFFQGLACGLCDAIHPLEYFDRANQGLKPDYRLCIKQTEHIFLHPSWRMNFQELKGIVQNLRKLRQCSISYRVEEDTDVGVAYHMRGHEEEKPYFAQLDTADMERYWEFRNGSITIGKLFGPEDLQASFGFRDLKQELYWRGRFAFNYHEHGPIDMQCLQTFAAVKTSELSKRFKPQQELTQDDLDAWINPLQFFMSEGGAIVTGIIWYLNLNCVRASRPPNAKLIEAELESKGLCFNVCPHYKMTHRTCVSAMLKAYAQGPDQYPEQHPVIENCSQCSTIIRFKLETPESAMISWHRGQYCIEALKPCLMVAVLRDLGYAKSALDPQWRAQLQRVKDVSSDDLAFRASYKGNLQDPPGEQFDEEEYEDSD